MHFLGQEQRRARNCDSDEIGRPNPRLDRRDFLKLLGLSSAATLGGASLVLTPRQILAADFSYPLIPANKQLDPAWVASLFARGTPTVVTGAALQKVGMPVGGICCGQLYLRGDGKLWFWDIFNAPSDAMLAGLYTGNYLSPFNSSLTPVQQGFALKLGGQYFKLDSTGFANISFTGQYPIGVVNYSDPACPVAVKLEAFSPFIPLNDNDSGIPATVMEFSLTNTSGSPVAVELAGWLQNAVCRFSGNVLGTARNHYTSAADHRRITGGVDPVTSSQVLFEDFESGTFLNAFTGQSWVVAGTAFGSAPVDTQNYPSSLYQSLSGFSGRYVINSHASAPPRTSSTPGSAAADSATRDQATGTLTSPTFTLNYNRIHFLICGGNHANETCFNLCRASDNAVLLSATGNDSSAYSERVWDVTAYVGQQVFFQVVDNFAGGWGNIGVANIRFDNVSSDIVFDDFERTTYAPWAVGGTAFGSGPVNIANVPAYQNPGTMGQHGDFLVNSHASAPGADVGAKDGATGTLTSAVFTITRKFINFLIGGGSHSGQTCMNLLVSNQVVRTSTGGDNNQLHQDSWNVSDLVGQPAQLQILDNVSGGWGNIGIDDIVFSDTPASGWQTVANAPDQGTMCLALLDPQPGDRASNDAPVDTMANLFAHLALNSTADVTRALPGQLVGALSRPLNLAAGASATVKFVIGWHVPKTANANATVNGNGWAGIQDIGTLTKYYNTLFADADAVASYVAANYAMLASKTRLWRDTWYDSTLPHWFLDRAFANTSILATNTAQRFSNGRFWGWEGCYCCPGTATHVWNYEQALGRIFPAIARDSRQRVDLGIGFDAGSGLIGARAENGMGAAVDGQASIILRCYREHQMSKDNTFLTTNWANLKKAMQWMISLDPGQTGILQGAQPNTLDADWYGKIAWLSGLYLAACKACQQMATDMADAAFATQLGNIAQAGAAYIQNNLFHNNEYFIQLPDGSSNNVGSAWGCEIDQVMGQSWAFQVGLGRLLDKTKTLSALARLWKYNFAPDAGGFRVNPANPVTGGRVYTDVGEAGLVMGTFPDPSHGLPLGLGWQNGYFSETMTGFEHEVASHMIWEGMLLEGLAITRAIHDRYTASKRNPYNEIECGDHYARAMASYGSHIAICGYEYHGPKAYLAFSPKLTPENFKAAFTAAEGWGSFHQVRTSNSQVHTVTIKHGQLKLKTFAFDVPAGAGVGSMAVTLNGSPVTASTSRSVDRLMVTLTPQQTIPANQPFVVQVGIAPLTIVQGEQVGGGFNVTWSSVPGHTYALECSNVLPASSWTPLATNLRASVGATTSYLDTSTGTLPARYYRIRIEP